MGETLAELSDSELRAVVSVVEALVRRDRLALQRTGAYEHGAAPFLWVDSYSDSGVELAMPPGEPGAWLGGAIRAERKPEWAGVSVEMYDRTAGRTDLTLELDVVRRTDGSIDCTPSLPIGRRAATVPIGHYALHDSTASPSNVGRTDR